MFKKALLLSFIILFLDQALKIYIKTHFYLYEEYAVAGDWFILHFTENNGMAFGLEFQGNRGKLFLSSFRILAIAGLSYYLYILCRDKMHKWYIYSISMVFAGAFGNIIDSVIYGVIFNESTPYQVSTYLPKSGGYAQMMYGKVVDMLYFPIIHSKFPTWFPFVGGEEFEFFSPVFNLADFSISCGVFILIINQKKFFENKDEENAFTNKTID